MTSNQQTLAQPPAPTDPPDKRRRRPFGLYMILILLTLQALVGVFATFFFGIGLVLLPGETWAELNITVIDLLEPITLLVITLVVVIGLWRYRAWSWYGMMLLLAYWMATDAIGYFTGTPEFGSMVINVAMVFYLNQREVRDRFATRLSSEVKA